MGHRAWCPYHSTFTNPRLYPPDHPCFTVYDDEKAKAWRAGCDSGWRIASEKAWDEGARRCDQAWHDGDAISVFDHNPYRKEDK